MSPWAIVLLPPAGAAAVFAFGRTRALAGSIAVATLLLTLGLAVAAAIGPPAPAGWAWGPRLQPSLVVDGFARLMAVLVPLIATPVAVYAAAAEPGGPAAQRRMLALIVAFVGAMELVVLAADLLSLLFGWELLAAFSWALIAHRWHEPERGAAARQAFLTTGFGALGLYLAAGAAFAGAGALDFAALGEVDGPTLDFVAAGVLLAAAAKSAQVPFSPWLSAAMDGPTPVSALLHSATMVAAGTYALLNPLFQGATWFAPAVIAIGLVTVVAGGMVAATETDVKRALAGSTSSQYGLMFVAVGAGSAVAAATHLATHAALKSLLFLGAGVAVHAAGTRELARLRLGRALPGAAIMFLIGALALAGVPPLGAAYSKELIAAAGAEYASWLGVVVAVAGALTAFYAIRLFLLAFGPGPRRSVRGPSAAETGALATLAALSVLLGMLWLPGSGRLLGRLLAAPVPEPALWETALAVSALAVGGAAAWLMWRAESLNGLALPDRVRRRAAGWLGLPHLTRVLVTDPVPRLAAALAHFDDRVVDAGVRAATRIGRAVSGLFAGPGERGLDDLVRGAARGTVALARGSRRTDERVLDALVRSAARATVVAADASRAADDRGVDAAVEGLGRGVGLAGAASRRLQTGLAHHYYLILAGGALAALAVLLLAR